MIDLMLTMMTTLKPVLIGLSKFCFVLKNESVHFYMSFLHVLVKYNILWVSLFPHLLMRKTVGKTVLVFLNHKTNLNVELDMCQSLIYGPFLYNLFSPHNTTSCAILCLFYG